MYLIFINLSYLRYFVNKLFYFIAVPRKPNYKKPVNKYSPTKKLNVKSKNRYRDHPPLYVKGKPVRPHRPTHIRQPPKVNPKPTRPNLKKVSKPVPEQAQRRDSSYGAPAPPQPQVIYFIAVYIFILELYIFLAIQSI